MPVMRALTVMQCASWESAGGNPSGCYTSRMPSTIRKTATITSSTVTRRPVLTSTRSVNSVRRQPPRATVRPKATRRSHQGGGHALLGTRGQRQRHHLGSSAGAGSDRPHAAIQPSASGSSAGRGRARVTMAATEMTMPAAKSERLGRDLERFEDGTATTLPGPGRRPARARRRAPARPSWPGHPRCSGRPSRVRSGLTAAR